MTSKQRVQKTFEFEKTDRVAVNYECNAGINGRLMAHYGAKSHDELLDALGVDFRTVWYPYKGPVLHQPREGKNVDPVWGITTRWIEHSSGGYWDYCDFPLTEADEEAVANYPMPNPDDFDYDYSLEMSKQYKDYGLFCGGAGLGCVINTNGFFRGMEQTLVDLLIDEPAGMLLTKRRMDIELAVMERMIDKCHENLDIMYMGEDLGTQIAPIISPDVYRRNIKPYHKRLIDLAASYNLKVMIHTCGSSSWAYPDFIEMGVRGVETLQPEAHNMTPEYLKKTYGDKLVFHGCISTAGPLAYGTADEVEQNVKETLDIMMEAKAGTGGGYCLSPTHQIQDNTPAENVVRMYEFGKKYGVYK